MPSRFSIDTYDYTLPEERIARFPLPNRDDSRLLLWNNGTISHQIFRDVPDLLPQDSMLVFNDTRVIAARLHFKKDTGAAIEIFLLHPELPTADISVAMTLTETATWRCLIGNKKRWKDGPLSRNIGSHVVTATYHDRDNDLITFTWTGGLPFAELINTLGETPLPPYLKRPAKAEDASAYQTVYSTHHGAVAAPTAGLHFTNNLLDRLSAKGIASEYLTLHVSAGTFRPVEKEDFREHDMHTEQVVVKTLAIENMLKHQGKLIAVGTTSLRILESLFWYGAMLKENPTAEFRIGQTTPYEIKSDLSFQESLSYVLDFLHKNKLAELHGETGIFIYPPYRIRSADGLFTNFHLPKSTLLLLIASFTEGRWKDIYNAALLDNYRFLSYGDSSLLLR